MNNFIKKFENTTRRCWDKPALTEYTTGMTYTYGQLAAEITSLIDLFRRAGLQKGDKITINAKSSVNWIKVYMAAACGGFVGVELLKGFLPQAVQALTVHSESKLLFTERSIFEDMDFEEMPQLLAVIDVNTGQLLAYRKGFYNLYKSYHVDPITKEELDFGEHDIDDTCAIMYTSGSTGNAKGVMLSIRNLGANEYIVPKRMFFFEGEKMLSILPYAHIFGLLIEITIPLCNGMHVTVLGQTPAPAILKKALCEVRPNMFFSVPMVLMKLVNAVIGTELNSPEGKEKMAHYQDYPEYCQQLHDKLMEAMGGRIQQIFTGGAAIPFDAEELIAFKLKMPMITGYGMTEVGGMLSNGLIGCYKHKSVGEVMGNLGLRIDSEDPTRIPGELQVKGDQVFSGYYKNVEATNAAFTYDGWYRTGDMGIVDKDRTIFLSGRCKSLLLSTNGQNIYPEEIEVILNVMPYVTESLIVQRENKFVALIVVNDEELQIAKLDEEAVNNLMHESLRKLNQQIPAYAAVTDFEIQHEPFSKTPKGSIRRFLYF